MTKPLVRIDPPLELGEIGWFRRALAKAITTTQGANADGVCHCVTPNQLREAVRAKRKKKQIIVSAFYYEGNPYGRFLKRAKNGWVLAKKSEKLFRIADWISFGYIGDRIRRHFLCIKNIVQFRFIKPNVTVFNRL